MCGHANKVSTSLLTLVKEQNEALLKFHKEVIENEDYCGAVKAAVTSEIARIHRAQSGVIDSLESDGYDEIEKILDTIFNGLTNSFDPRAN